MKFLIDPFMREQINKIIELLDIIEVNLKKLGIQYESGQHTLIVDTLDKLAELRHLTSQSNVQDITQPLQVKMKTHKLKRWKQQLM